MASANSHFPKVFLVNSTEVKLVANSISWNVRSQYRVWPTCAFMTAKQRIYHPNCISQVSDTWLSFRFVCLDHYNFFALVVCACLFMQNDCWHHISTISVNYILRLFKWIRCTFIILHFWWCFSRDLDMVEIGQPSQRPFAIPRISTSNFGIFKD